MHLSWQRPKLTTSVFLRDKDEKQYSSETQSCLLTTDLLEISSYLFFLIMCSSNRCIQHFLKHFYQRLSYDLIPRRGPETSLLSKFEVYPKT